MKAYWKTFCAHVRWQRKRMKALRARGLGDYMVKNVDYGMGYWLVSRTGKVKQDK